MPHNPSRPLSEGRCNADVDPRLRPEALETEGAAVRSPPEARSFGSDDMEGARAGDDEQLRPLGDGRGRVDREAERPPSGVSRTVTGQDGSAGPQAA